MEKNNYSGAELTSEQLKKELERSKSKPKAGGFLKGAIVVLIVITAFISVLTTLYFPIMSIHGGSMTPNLEDGNLVVAIKTEEFERGDICAFYSGSSVLCKRIIAFGGETIDMDENGIVYINGLPLTEDYIIAADIGNVDIVFPYTVPEHTYFVMGDNRSTSIDSRSTKIGCVSESQMIGKLVYRFWPFDKIGPID